jgi:hypothetical protein
MTFLLIHVGQVNQLPTPVETIGDDEVTVAARYGLVASERYFFSTSVL